MNVAEFSNYLKSYDGKTCVSTHRCGGAHIVAALCYDGDVVLLDKSDIKKYFEVCGTPSIDSQGLRSLTIKGILGSIGCCGVTDTVRLHHLKGPVVYYVMGRCGWPDSLYLECDTDVDVAYEIETQFKHFRDMQMNNDEICRLFRENIGFSPKDVKNVVDDSVFVNLYETSWNR